ncbi:LCP family protein, partial [Salsipaludibacter albus]|uniref:LCP family glycopolymer transferase n=1 Tax=Salsipaludibacter albus TaxID=2849650 RepID=UPI001EE444FC|nr:LCP family protein [Salsipaludibacter albus]
MSDPSVFRSVRRPDRRRVHLAGRLVRILVVVAILVVLGVAGWLLWRTTNALEPLELQTFVLNETDPDALTDSVPGTSTTLVVGVDRRQAPPEDLAGSDADPRGMALTPAVMLLQTSPERPGTAVVTFPANLAVDPPGVVGQTSLDRVQALGGPDLLLATVQDATGMPIDHYVEVDLAGVVDVVDAVGGVEVCLDDVVLGPEPSAGGAGASAAPTAGATPTPTVPATD